MGNRSVKTRQENDKRVVEYYDESGNKTKTYVDGEAAWRNNNPGNIKWNGKRDPGFFKDKLGAFGSDGTFAVFPSREDGLGAKTKLMKLEQNMNIRRSMLFCPTAGQSIILVKHNDQGVKIHPKAAAHSQTVFEQIPARRWTGFRVSQQSDDLGTMCARFQVPSLQIADHSAPHACRFTPIGNATRRLMPFRWVEIRLISIIQHVA